MGRDLFDVDIPVAQHFTERNSWGFSERRLYQDFPHALRIPFINEARGYLADQQFVYDDGYDETNATKFQQIDLPGITDPDLIWRHGRFQIAQMQLRPSEYSLTTNWQALACQVGSKVYAANDVAFWGLARGRVIAIDTVNDIVTLDSEVTMDGGVTQYGIRFRLADGSTLVREVENVGGAQTVLQLLSDAPMPQPAVGDLGMFGVLNSEAVLLRVKEINWQADMTATLTLVDDAPEIDDADQGDIPEFNSQVTLPVNIFDIAPTSFKEVETIYLAGNVARAGSILTWQAAQSTLMTGFEIEMRDDTSTTPEWRRLGVNPPSLQNFFIEDLATGTYSFRVRTTFTNGRFSDWSTLNNVVFDGLLAAPPDVENFQIKRSGETGRLTWDKVNVANLDHYVIRFTPSFVDVSWGGAVVIADNVTTEYADVDLKEGTYLIKAVTVQGVFSVNATTLANGVTGINDQNVVEILTEDPTFAGVLDNIFLDTTLNAIRLKTIDTASAIKSLLHFEGTDAATVFTDDTDKPWTANGDAQIDTAQFKFGAASGLFDGTGDWIDTPDHADFNLAAAEFAIDLWIRPAGAGTLRRIVGQAPSTLAAATTSFYIELTTGNVLQAYVSNGSTLTTLTGTTVVSTTAQHHVELSRVGNTIYLFLDGVLEASAAFSGTVPDSANKLAIGRAGEATGNPYNGWIDEFRLRTGASAGGHSAGFTVPSAPQASDVPAVGYYYFDNAIDLGDIYTSRLTVNLLAYGDNLDNDFYANADFYDPLDFYGGENTSWLVTIEYRSTNDAPGGSPVTWSSWATLIPGDYSARAYEFRAKLESLATGATPFVLELGVTVDMPDRFISENDVTCPNTGLTVAWDGTGANPPPFLSLKGIAIAAQDLATGDYPTITSKDENGFSIIFKDSTNAGVERVFDYIARGWGKKLS